MNCKDCMYWERIIVQNRRREPWEKFFHKEADSFKSSGNCSNDKFVYTDGTDKSVPPIDGLGYWDHDGYDAGFETGENFGCIHFKGKEEPA